MSLQCLLYCSTINPLAFDDDHLYQSIACQSKRNNEKNHITGFLFFKQDIFIQYFEGKKNAVNALFNTIKSDTRHCNIKVLMYQPLAHRKFNYWQMQAFDCNYAQEDILISEQFYEFAPYYWDDNNVEHLIHNVQSYYQDQCISQNTEVFKSKNAGYFSKLFNIL